MAEGTLDTSFITSTATNAGANNTVTAIAIQNGKILIAGSFDSFSGNTVGRITRLDTAGLNDASFNLISGVRAAGAGNQINAIVVQPDNKILIGGMFTSYNSVNGVNRITRLNEDGTRDTSFNTTITNALRSGANNTIDAIALQPDGKILIGGRFTSYNDTPINYLARINTDGTLDSDFKDTIGTNLSSHVYAIAIQSDGKIIIGGAFIAYGSNSVKHIARLNSNGSLDTDFNSGGAGANDFVRAIAIQADGKIVVGGYFTTFNGSTTYTQRITRLTTSGTLDPTFLPNSSPWPGANNVIFSLAIQTDGKILIGGGFTYYDGNLVNRIARININGSYDSTFNNVSSGTVGSGSNDTINAIAIMSNKILIGGSFITYNGTTKRRIARLFGPEPPPATAPGAPTFATPALISKNDSIEVRWAAPSSDGGATIIRYEVEYKAAGASGYTAITPVTGLSATVAGLSDNVTYSFRVRAVNSVDAGAWTATDATGQTVTAPSAPQSFVATPGNGQITLTWSAPASTGGDPIDGYKLSYGPTGGTMSLYTGTLTSTGTVITTLADGTTALTVGAGYDFSLVAYNGEDPADGAAATQMNIVPYGAPQITAFDCVLVDTSAVLTWTIDWKGAPTSGRSLTMTSSDTTLTMPSLAATDTTTTITVVAGRATTFTLTVSSSGGSVSATSSSVTAICFLGNAPVLTPGGYRRIDRLAVGDKVQTADGRIVAIQKVFARQYDPSPAVNPYVIPKGEFGATKDMYVSPMHRIMVPGRGMVEARLLGLQQCKLTKRFTYYNLELPNWKTDNLVVAGIEAESLAPVRRIEVTKEQFLAILRAKYGALTPDVIARAVRTCFFTVEGKVNIPMLKRK